MLIILVNKKNSECLLVLYTFGRASFGGKDEDLRPLFGCDGARNPGKVYRIFGQYFRSWREKNRHHCGFKLCLLKILAAAHFELAMCTGIVCLFVCVCVCVWACARLCVCFHEKTIQ